MTSTLLVTGGSGYLGSHLIRQARKPWRVVATHLSHAANSPGCQWVALDIRNGAAVSRLLAGLRPDIDIHTASDMSSPEAMLEVIVEGSRNVASGCASVGARLVHLSTDMIFDGEHGPYAESDPPAPLTAYGRAKTAAEQIVSHLQPDAAIVRTSLIYGFDPPDPRTRWVVDSILQKQPITLFSDEVRCPVWVEQLASALLELAAGEQGGLWHLAGPQCLSRYEFGERLALAYGLNPEGVTRGLSRESGLRRPRDLRLDVRKAQARLKSPLWGVDKVLAHTADLSPAPTHYGSASAESPPGGS